MNVYVNFVSHKTAEQAVKMKGNLIGYTALVGTLLVPFTLATFNYQADVQHTADGKVSFVDSYSPIVYTPEEGQRTSEDGSVRGNQATAAHHSQPHYQRYQNDDSGNYQHRHHNPVSGPSRRHGHIGYHGNYRQGSRRSHGPVQDLSSHPLQADDEQHEYHLSQFSPNA